MPLDQNELEILAARFVLDKVEAYEVRGLADRLTTEGDDDPVLIEIYIKDEDLTKEDIHPYLERFLEGRVELPIAENAAGDLAYRYCKRATLGLIDFEDAADFIERIYNPFHWNGLKIDFDDFRWIAIGAAPKSSAEPLCRKLVDDFEAGEMRRWIPKPPRIRKGILGFLDRLHGV